MMSLVLKLQVVLGESRRGDKAPDLFDRLRTQ
jgi:hypothetical protein